MLRRSSGPLAMAAAPVSSVSRSRPILSNGTAARPCMTWVALAVSPSSPPDWLGTMTVPSGIWLTSSGAAEGTKSMLSTIWLVR